LLAEIAEALFRGFGLSSGALALAGLFAWMFRQDGSSQSSLAFSIVLHAALLVMTYELYDPADEFVWPGSRALTGNYLATRIENEPKPIVPTVGEKKDTGAAAPKSPEPPKKVATKGNEGAAGGKGETERARDKNNKTDEPPAPPKAGIFEDRNARQIADLLQRNNQTSLSKFMGIPGAETKPGSLGFGHGTGTGVGEGNGTGTTRGGKGRGPGGGGNYEGDLVTDKGPIDTGAQRPGGGNCATPPCGHNPKPISVAVGDAEGDIEGLTAEEIRRVVAARQGVFRACYQKELNRSPGIGGKLNMHFVIGGDGVVKSAKTGSNSTFHNESVEECVSSNIMRLHFPAKGGLSNVNFPFIFQPGG
jgi:hypothetical protein